MLYAISVQAVIEKRNYIKDSYIPVHDTHLKPTKQRELEASWGHYLTDSCTMYNTAISNEDELRELGLRRCEDKTTSFVQPASSGAGGWEGRCGHTAAANAYYTICKNAVNPLKYFGPLLGDITPGVRPKTLRSGLSRTFSKNTETCPERNAANWTYIKLGNTKNYIKRVKEYLTPNYSHINLQNVERNGESYLRNPVIALIQNPGGGKFLHWVTIIDVLANENVCRFVVNHWDNQYQVPCETFANWARKVGHSYPLILKSYSVVTLK